MGIVCLNRAVTNSGIGTYANLMTKVVGEKNVVSFSMDKRSRNENFPGVLYHGFYPPFTSGWYLNYHFPSVFFKYRVNKKDTYHLLSPFIFPLPKNRHIVTFHDLYYIKQGQRSRLNRITKDYMKCENVLTVSRTTKLDLVKVGFEDEFITPIHLCVDDYFRDYPVEREVMKEKFVREHDIKKPIILTVGDGYNKNNQFVHETIKDDFFHIHVGKDIRADLNYENIGLDTMIGLYDVADVFVRFSLYEGFGIPPIEALMRKTPCVVSDISVFHETLGNSVYYSKLQKEDLRNAISSAIKDEEELLKEFNAKYREYYSFKRFRNDMLNYYRKVEKSLASK